MFLKSLTITDKNGEIIRDIQFHLGLNLIVDETPVVSGKETGNNVGKTTVLKLIDYCLGAKAKGIYSDQEDQKNEYKLVKNYLIENNIKISLVLKDDLNIEDSREVLIERNFKPRKEKLQSVNRKNKTDEEFLESLTNILFPDHYGSKPTFRQIISHNIRYSDQSINNTLKTLDRYTTDIEYETLYLFLFGCDYSHGATKQLLNEKIRTEENFKKRLESDQTKSAYEAALSIISNEIAKLEKRKSTLDINPDFEILLEEMTEVKYNINYTSSEITRLEIRRDLILESETEMRERDVNIDLQELKLIYEQSTSLVTKIQKTFEELYVFHKKMIDSKIKFITKELPEIDTKLRSIRTKLHEMLEKELALSGVITKSDSFDVLEKIISELNSKYQQKGDYTSTLRQINTVDKKLKRLNEKWNNIDKDMFSDEVQKKITEQLDKFNLHFSSISDELYNEKYALKVDQAVKKGQGRRYYKFTAFNTNISSGKKQGEISCFYIAYTLFADEEKIPCMHFLLNDKKELMHDNQIVKISKLVEKKGIQLVSSILKDKLPDELKKEEYIVIKLSQEDKLFRIEGRDSQ